MQPSKQLTLTYISFAHDRNTSADIFKAHNG